MTTTAAVRPQGTASNGAAAPKNPVVYSPARYRREVRWGLRHTPSPAERRQMRPRLR